jgi:hypothetical protein
MKLSTFSPNAVFFEFGDSLGIWPSDTTFGTSLAVFLKEIL